MRVEVDHDLCEANAICVGIDPAVFELDDDDAFCTGAEFVADGGATATHVFGG
jgi:ferredoxin